MSQLQTFPRVSQALLLSACLFVPIFTTTHAAERGIHGRVYELDENGRTVGPVTDATVTLLDLSGKAAAEAKSGEGGYYRLDAGPGRYTYKVTAPGFQDEDQGRGIQLQLSDGYGVVDFTLIRGANDPDQKQRPTPTSGVGTLSGKVIHDAGGFQEGIPGAVISLKGPNDARLLMQVVSSRDRRNSFEKVGDYSVVLAAGEWQGSVSADGFETLVETEPILITADQAATHDFVLTKKLPPEIRNQGIRVRVTHAEILSGDEVPPEGVVHIVAQQHPAVMGSPVAADESGTHTRNLPVGIYRVIASAAAYQTSWSPPVEVVRGKYTLVEIALKKATSVGPSDDLNSQGIRGVVTIEDPEARPELIAAALAQTRVYITPNDQTTTLTNPIPLDKDGNFSRALPVGGPYKVIALARGYESASVLSRALPGVYSDVELTLRRTSAAPVPGRPVFSAVVYGQAAAGADKYPLSRASVLFRGPNQTLSEAPRAITDENGNVEFDIGAEGNYAVLAQKEGYVPGGVRVAIGNDQRVKREITLLQRDPEDMPSVTEQRPGTEPITFSGYVVMRDTRQATGIAPLPDSKLRWIPLGGDPAGVQEALTQPGGRFDIELVPGQYQFDVHPPAGMQNKLMGASEQLTLTAAMPLKYFVLPPLGGQTPTEPDEPGRPGRTTVGGFVVTETNGRFEAVPGALLTWRRPQSQRHPIARSGARGQFTVSLESGDYQVAVKAPAGFNDDSVQVPVRPGMPPRYFILTRRSGSRPNAPDLATLDIRVLEPMPAPQAARPLPGASVAMIRNNQVVSRSNADGQGRVSFQLQPGSYEILTAQVGYEAERGVMKLNSGRISRDVYLRRGARQPGGPGPTPVPMPTVVTLNVQVGGVTPQSGNRVSLLNGASVGITQNGLPVAAGTTNSNGVFSARLQPGVYSVSSSYPLFQTKAETIRVVSGTQDHRILLQSSATSPASPGSPSMAELNLQVGGVNPRGGNQVLLLGDAEVTIRQNGQQVTSGATDKNGRYSTRLQPGAYEIEVRYKNYYDAKETVSAAAGRVDHRVLLRPRVTID